MAANKKGAPAAAPAKAATKSINRARRNSLERKCLTKSSKRLYMGAGKELFRQILAGEQAARLFRKKGPSRDA